ncbi:hypothetical protein GX48_01487 [Paracoccidioides brasiliensis]|nr:hypothetical protein GX48_01487 [Paracoccidioides brasiliensis]
MWSFRLQITTGWIPVQAQPQSGPEYSDSEFWDWVVSTTCSTLQRLVDRLEAVHPHIGTLDVSIVLENSPGKQRASEAVQLILQPLMRLRNVLEAHVRSIDCSFTSPTERPVDLLNSPEENQTWREVDDYVYVVRSSYVKPQNGRSEHIRFGQISGNPGGPPKKADHLVDAHVTSTR